MSELVPLGYLSRLEAIFLVAQSLFAGMPDQPQVTKLREEGIDVADGGAIDKANVELWRGVDERKVEVFACGSNGQLLRIEACLTEQVPFLRNSRGGDFTYSRPRTLAYSKMVSQFGPQPGGIFLVFLKRDVEKWARSLVRKRRNKSVTIVRKRRVGRPSRKAEVMKVIRTLLDNYKWDASMSLKALAQYVNRNLQGDKPISEETVTRALDQLYEDTGDRQFARIHRKAA